MRLGSRALAAAALLALLLEAEAREAPTEGDAEPWNPAESEFMVKQIRNFGNFSDANLKAELQLVSQEETATGNFYVFEFPLSFSKFTIYRRRFGVDVPADCLKRSCPVLFDFHGSYDSLFSQRYWTRWYKYLAQVPPENLFVLVTPEGSPDAVTNPTFKLNNSRNGTTGTSTTSWNVLGWGDATVPLDDKRPGCGSFSDSGCFTSALTAATAYPCFQTRLEMAPRSCKAATFDDLNGTYEVKPGAQMLVRRVCASTSAANDWDYLSKVLQFVWKTYGIDRERIYFTGQSMGGMASLQFAVDKDKYSMQDFTPAALVACSASGARANSMELHGKVKTLLMHGSLDDVAPATVWAGYSRDLVHFLQNDTMITRWQTKDMVSQAMQITSNSTLPLGIADKRFLILEANLMTGGELLQNATKELDANVLVGCPLEDPLPISRGGYMWEGFDKTLERVAGRKVDMAAELAFALPAKDRMPPALSAADRFKCAKVPRTGAEIEVCTFHGGHSWPFQDDSGDWLPEAGADGKVFHDFIWMDWLQGGKVRRPTPSSAASPLHV